MFRSTLIIRILLLVLIAVPLVELWLLIAVGSSIGVLNTLGLCVLSAFVGYQLVRAQGFATLRQVQQQLQVGNLPATSLWEALLLLLAGLCLLLPGFLTDALGLLLLVPGLRSRLALHLAGSGEAYAGGRRASSGPRVIEGEFKREERE